MKSVRCLFFCFFALIFCNNIIQAQCPQGDVILTSQAEVDDFATAYPSCTEITGELQIGISWGNTSDITDLSNLPPIESIGGGLGIYYNNDLVNLSGLENLTSIGDYLWISDNAVTDLSGLENLTSIGGVLIYDNATLTDLSSLENVTSIGGSLDIGDNATLTDLSGLENLTSVGGRLLIINSALTDLSGLENLTSVGGFLGIRDNTALTDLSGLENMTSIGGMWIKDNNILTDLSGLENVTSIGGDLWIYDNPTLSICAVPPICDYLESGGVSEIYDNAPNCNSAEEILALCTVSTTTPDNLPQITISPNPGEGIFQVNGIPKGTYQIHDTTGRTIQSGNMQNDLSIDISQEARGVYFISIHKENEVISRRIIKM